MTTLSPSPFDDEGTVQTKPPSFWQKLLPGKKQRVAAGAGGLVGVVVAGVLGASYYSAPGGTLWGLQTTVFPSHSQDIALTSVVSDLKSAQDILGGGQQPSADQLSSARSSLNSAKQGLDYVDSSSPQRADLQNLYMQLNQQLLAYTPAEAQQLAPIPVPATDDSGTDQSGDSGGNVALASSQAPTWGYSGGGDASGDATSLVSQNYAPPPPDGVPADPDADWPQPDDPPATPNLGYTGGYNPTWGQLYGYNQAGWYNYDLSGYNMYGYDFTGYDRWGYDRWGYDRWGYDHYGYNYGGYNWAGYDRDGYDHGGYNEWHQHRGGNDPRDQDWYNIHHPYVAYYGWKFEVVNPVYQRTQWNKAHGFDPNRYQDWNRNRDWSDPRNRDWAPPPTTVNNIHIDNSRTTIINAPVVNLNVSLAQFVADDKNTVKNKQLLSDMSHKSVGDLTKDLNVQATAQAKAEASLSEKAPDQKPGQTPGQKPGVSGGVQVGGSAGPGQIGGATTAEASIKPPSLTAAPPAAPPSRVSKDFKPPTNVPAVAAVTPAPVTKAPESKPGTAPDDKSQENKPGSTPGEKPSTAPEDKPVNTPGEKPGTEPDQKRQDKPEQKAPESGGADQNQPGSRPTQPGDAKPTAPENSPVQRSQAPQAPTHEAPPSQKAPEAPTHEAPPSQKAPEAPAAPAAEKPAAPAPQKAPEAPAAPPSPASEPGGGHH